MLKFPKYVTVLFAILLLAVLLVTMTQAQKSAFPPLPDLNRVLAPPGATPTARPDEKRPNDIGKPTVTPIPYREIIDQAGNNIRRDDKTTFTVRKTNGDYVKILVGPEHLKGATMQDVRSILGLSAGDEIVSFEPPASSMGGYLGLHKQLTTPTPATYKINEVIDKTNGLIPVAKKSAFIVRSYRQIGEIGNHQSS